MNILAVGANPDDVEFLCAGTLARYAKRGDSVSISYLTTGDKGSSVLPQAEIAEIRKEESRKAADVIGATVIPLGIPDGEVENTLAQRRLMVDVVRKTQPDVIITHYPRDYMSDHNCTSRLVTDASFWAGAPNFEGIPENLPFRDTFAPVFYMDTLGGIGFQPEEYVDITDVFELKLEMLSQHKSQIDWMKEQTGLDFIDYMKTVAKFRGYQSRVTYAEGFIAARRYPMLGTHRILP